MKITKVTVDSHERGIPLVGWENVEKAIRLHDVGVSNASSATHDDLVQNMGSAGGLFGLGILLMNEQNQGSFVDQLLKEAKKAVKKEGNWRRSYDYDGPGNFHKTQVEIITLDKKQQLYMLMFWAAYVGDAPEKALAEYLGIPRTLRSYSVTVEVAPEDETHFAFDFEKVLRSLDEALDTKGLKGDLIANYYLLGDAQHNQKKFVLSKGANYLVTIAPGLVEHRFIYPDRKPIDTWSRDGSILRGLLRDSWKTGEEGKKMPPTFEFVLTNSKRDSYGDGLPIWDAEVKDELDNKAHEIKAALMKNPVFEI